MKKILLLGIESYKNRIKKLTRQLYPQYSCQSIDKNSSFLEIKQKYSNHEVIAIINRGEKLIDLHSELIDYYQVPGPSKSAIKLSHDKASLHSIMIEHRLSHYRPQTIVVSFSQLQKKIERVSFPIIIKPNYGTKSRGVFLLKSKADFTKEVIESLKDKQKILIEEFIAGQQLTSTSYIDHAGKVHTIGFVDVLTGRDFGFSHQQLVTRTTPSHVSNNVKRQVSDLLQNLANISGLKSTLIHPEFMVLPDEKIKLIELNLRAGGLRYEINKYAFDINIDLISLQLALGENPIVRDDLEGSCTGVDLWSEKTGTIENIKLPKSKYLIESKVYFKPGDKYLAPPSGNKQLARFFVKTHSDSFTVAKKIIQKSKIVIK